MKGWKTKAGACFIVVSAILRAVGVDLEIDELIQYSNTVFTVGSALGIVGIGHKLEKNK